MATRPTSGTQTHTITLDPPSSSSSSSNPSESVVLRLRPSKKKVQWKEGTVDNEHMNKKKSKKCCIFHKEKPFDEDYSDDEDSNNSNGGGDPGAGGSSEPGGCCSHGGSGKAAKKKKIHAFKSKVRQEQLEVVQNKRQNAWQQFQTSKGKTKKVGFFSGRKRESIFKSPEDPKGKVGVTGSGKGLTEFQKREKHLHLKGSSYEGPDADD